jgi:hypothetical protein
VRPVAVKILSDGAEDAGDVEDLQILTPPSCPLNFSSLLEGEVGQAKWVAP